MRPHRVLHTTVGISSVLHSHISISISHLRRCSWGRLRMRTHTALILFVSKSSRRLGLCSSVVISRHRRLVLRITVVSSRRAGGIRVRSPLIHDESVGLEVFARGRYRRSFRQIGLSVDCLESYEEAQRVVAPKRDRLATSYSRTRRKRRKSLFKEAVGAR